MKIAAITIILFLPFLALSSTFAQTREMTLPAGDIYELRVYCGAGSLYITNAEWQNTIRVFAEIEVEDKIKLDDQEFAEKYIDLRLDRQGSRAILKSDLKRTFLHPADARINLTIEIPRGVDLFIDDGSGSIHIQYVAGHLDIKDDSGRITVEKVVGNVRVADGSGEIILEDIQGNVEVKDGSGDVDVNKVGGNVRVTDSSGKISIQYVNGNVTVTDESGEIDINDITGNVLIRGPGTGELNIERVKGTVTTQNQIEDISPKILNE
jgi:DUF4097 and DUF4098 domain-containing protein YvlB